MTTTFRAVLAATLVASSVRVAQCATAVLSPSADASIFQNNVNNGSGAGNGLYTGTNMSGFVRRALLAFDIEAALPAGSIVQSVELSAVLGDVSGGSPPPLVTVNLHRLLDTWGEGTSQQQTPPSDVLSMMGQGVAAMPGDVTWNSRFHSSTLWETPGGDFESTASGSASIPSAKEVRYSWSSTPAMVSDVQAWLDNPASNLGWLLKGGAESTSGTLRGFYSSDVATEDNWPQLHITYTAATPGDFDGDGFVDGDDLSDWESQFGSAGVYSADADQDSDVDGADFLVWQRHVSPSMTLIPEPATWLLLAIGAAAAGNRRRG